MALRMGFEPLTDEQLFDDHENDGREDRIRVLRRYRGDFGGNAPLWFYILREAELLERGARLGPVGGTIVAEVLAGLMIEDRHSFLSMWPKWRPTLGRAKDEFSMADLVSIAQQRPLEE